MRILKWLRGRGVGRVPVYEDIEVVGRLCSLAVSLKQLIQHVTYRQHRGTVLEVRCIGWVGYEDGLRGSIEWIG